MSKVTKRNRSGEKREILRRVVRIMKSDYYDRLPKSMKDELRAMKRTYSKPGRARS